MQQLEDLRTTLFVNQREALQGSTRIVTLPGNRRVSFTAPAGVRDGEQIRLRGEGLSSPDGGPPSDLVISIMYRQTREVAAFKRPDKPASYDYSSQREQCRCLSHGYSDQRYPNWSEHGRVSFQ